MENNEEDDEMIKKSKDSIRIIPKHSKKNRRIALAASVMMLISACASFSAGAPVNAMGLSTDDSKLITIGDKQYSLEEIDDISSIDSNLDSVVREGEGSTQSSSEGSSENSTETTETKEKKNQNIMEASTTRIGFWEWQEVTTDNVRKLMSDGLYHASMFIPCYAKDVPNPKKENFAFAMSSEWSPGGTYDYTWCKNEKVSNFAANVETAGRLGTSYFVPYCHYGSYMSFWSTYADRDHIKYGNVRSSYHDYNDFGMLGYNPETSNNHKEGYYGVDFSGNAKHSLSYYFSAAYNMYIKQDWNGYENGVDSSNFYREKFFTFGDSMGVPMIKYRQIAENNRNIEVEFNIPREQLSNGEAANYTPVAGKDYWLYGAVVNETNDNGHEPILYFKKTDSSDKGISSKDYLHIGISKNGDKNNKIWYITTYNNTIDNDLTYEKLGYGLTSGEDDMSVITFAPWKDLEWIICGPRRQAGMSMFKWYIGTPHEMTALNTQTVKTGQVLPLIGGQFMGADKKLQFTDGYIIQKDKTLTIDGGTVTVGTNLINNGKIVIKNGGTLLIKSAGCVYPFMEDTLGTIECTNGNVIVMEGGKLYSLKSYKACETPLKMSGGSTLINYGTFALTEAYLDKGSKIENRKNGIFFCGVNRKDQLYFMDKASISKTSITNIDYVNNITELKNKETTTDKYLTEHPQAIIDTQYLTIPPDTYEAIITHADGTVETYVIPDDLKENWKKLVDEHDLTKSIWLNSLKKSRPEVCTTTSPEAAGGVKSTSASFGIRGYGGAAAYKPVVKNEKTATFNHKSGDRDFADGVDIITPEY